jgi:hypothetical protein
MRRLLIGCLLTTAALSQVQTVPNTDFPTFRTNLNNSLGYVNGTASTITYYICPAALANCAYNGDGGQSATPSDSNAGTSKALPWATVAHAAAVLANTFIAGPVVLQLADTSTSCYQDSEVKFAPRIQGGYQYNVFEIGFGSYTDTYPTAYLEFKGNISTPANVKWTAAATCGGTTSAARTAVRIAHSNAVFHGINFKYFGASNTDNASIQCSDQSNCFVDNMTNTGDGSIGSKLMLTNHSGTNGFYGPNLTTTESGVGYVNYNSWATSRTPAGWMSVTTSMSSCTGCYVWVANEGGHITIWGPTTQSISGSSVFTVYEAIAQSFVNTVNAAAAPSGNSTFTLNAGSATYLSARQNSEVVNSCGGTGNTCTITSTGAHSRANAGGQVFEFGTNSTGSLNDDVSAFGTVVYSAFSSPTGVQVGPARYYRGQSSTPTLAASSGDGQVWYKSDNTGFRVQNGSSTDNYMVWAPSALTSGRFVGGLGTGQVGAQDLVRALTFSFTSPVVNNTGYMAVPFKCSITGYDIMLDTGTATIKTWSVNGGTAIPTSSNSISTSGVAISSGTAVHSNTVSDWSTGTCGSTASPCLNGSATTPQWVAFTISAISGSPAFLTFTLECTQ